MFRDIICENLIYRTGGDDVLLSGDAVVNKNRRRIESGMVRSVAAVERA
jgi:hypothetical protein